MRLLRSAALSLVFASSAAAAGGVLREPAVLYDSHSLQATPKFILTAGHPLREISRVDGWRKVSLFSGDDGWVRERAVRDMRAAVVREELAAARANPSPSSPEVFYARRRVVLEVLRGEGAWLEVLHPDGETGYVAAADVWLNY